MFEQGYGKGARISHFQQAHAIQERNAGSFREVMRVPGKHPTGHHDATIRTTRRNHASELSYHSHADLLRGPLLTLHQYRPATTAKDHVNTTVRTFATDALRRVALTREQLPHHHFEFLPAHRA